MPKTPEEQLHDAVVSFAQGVSMNLGEIVEALRQDGKRDIAEDLLALHSTWRQTTEGFLTALAGK